MDTKTAFLSGLTCKALARATVDMNACFARHYRQRLLDCTSMGVNKHMLRRLNLRRTEICA